MTETAFLDHALKRLKQHYEFALPICQKHPGKEPAWLRAPDIASTRTRDEVAKAYRLLYNELLNEYEDREKG